MKKWTKLLMSTTMVAMMAMPLAGIASAHQSHETKVVMNEVKKPDLAATKGVISEIVYNKYGAFAMLEGKGVKPENPDTIKLLLDDKVEIVDLKGKKVDIRDVVKNQWTVTASYGPMMTMSIPPQSPAVKIVVDKPETPVTELTEYIGVIKSIKEVEFENDDDDDEEEYEYNRIVLVGKNPAVLMVDDHTVIVNEQGKKLDDNVLRKNVLIKAIVDPKETTTSPSMLKATKIVVLKENGNINSDAVRAEGTIVKIDDNQIHLDVKSDNKLDNDVILNISKETKIINEHGTTVKLSNLKKGSKIVSYHSPKITKSIPGQTNAEMILITK